LFLARRMVQPIQALQAGATRIGSGALDQRIEVHTGDELEALAEEFNRMTERLRDSYANLEQKVTERTRDLAEALAQLEVANQHKSDLLSTVSHELRTPLGAIKGYATALLRFGPRIRQAERREFLESIDRAADRLSALIEDLLLAQRLEAGKLPITPEPLNLAELAEEVVAELAPRATDHDFVCLLPPDLPLACGDPRRVRQVLLNLLDNAVKYSPDGGEIRIAADARNGDLAVSVRDEGLGIPADHITRVFERFHRVETSITRSTRGTGLGLAICQGIVQAQGGRIWAESPGEGAGSTFCFTLPRWEDE
jgi:signal transduction histidine kinase